jgi:hypothetical protein
MEHFKVLFFRLGASSNWPDLPLKFQKILLLKLTLTSVLCYSVLLLARLLLVIHASQIQNHEINSLAYFDGFWTPTRSCGDTFLDDC